MAARYEARRAGAAVIVWALRVGLIGAAARSDSRVVYGDAAYGTGAVLAWFARNGIVPMVKCQPPTNKAGLFAKDRFEISDDLAHVTCPGEVTVETVAETLGRRRAHFADACSVCPLREECTTSANGRTIRIGPHERRIGEARRVQQEPGWVENYRKTRPKVERKLAHLLRPRRHTRYRGIERVKADWNLAGAAVNAARPAVLGVHLA